MQQQDAKRYDVVVIGAGNGGLTAAIRVLQGGYSCLLLEKHNLPGGFEASLHELNDFGSPTLPAISAPCSGIWAWRIRSTGCASPKPIT